MTCKVQLSWNLRGNLKKLSKDSFQKVNLFYLFFNFFFFSLRVEVLLESFLWSSIGMGPINSEGAWISWCCSFFLISQQLQSGSLLPDRGRRILCTVLVQGAPVVNVQGSLHPSCALLCLLHGKKPCKNCLIQIYCGILEFSHSVWWSLKNKDMKQWDLDFFADKYK